jgi:viroplasmin and RNaseH domain-containing protein
MEQNKRDKVEIYVVVKGRKLGFFSTWYSKQGVLGCEPQVKGLKKSKGLAQFRKFDNVKAAEEYWYRHHDYRPNWHFRLTQLRTLKTKINRDIATKTATRKT